MHRVLLLYGGIGKVHGVLLILPKVTMEMHQVLNERDLLIAVVGKILRDKTFMNSIYVLQMDRLQLTPDGECKHNTSNDPFSRCKNVQLMATGQN